MDFGIRQARPSDAAQMVAFVHRLCDEPDIDIPMAPGEFAITVEEEAKILQEVADSETSVFLVADAENEIVGVLNCFGEKRKATRHVAELGISIAQKWRGQGIGDAMLAAAIQWAKDTKIIRRIELQVFARNTAAIRLYEKHGFQEEGRRRDAVFRNGEYLDDLVMGLLLESAGDAPPI